MFTNHNSCYSFTLTFFKTDSDKQLSTCSGPSICSSGGDGNSGGDSGPPGDGPGPSHRPPPSVNKKTPQQIAGEGVLQRIIEAVDGISFSFR